MKISMILPIYNEVKTIVQVQESLQNLKGRCEILFVDGGSNDGTLERILPEFRVISSPKGRANQMNTGAEKSTGDVLFFVHCDSELPKTALFEIEKVMKQYDAGCFGIRFHSKNISMKCCQVLSNCRAKYGHIIFGDQGIFIKKDVFIKAGGFPSLPIMEDYQLSLTLKEMKVKTGMTKSRIYTSDRRFVEGGRLRVMWKMNRLRAMYRRGVDIYKISELYRDIR